MCDRILITEGIAMDDNKGKIEVNKDKEAYAKLVAEKLKDKTVLKYLKSIKTCLIILTGIMLVFFVLFLTSFIIGLVS